MSNNENAPASNNEETDVDDRRRSCRDFPWGQTLRICNGVGYIGVWIAAFFCFSQCGSPPAFRDVLLSCYVLVFAVVGLAAEVRTGMQFLFKRFPFLGRYIWRGVYTFFVATISLGGQVFQIIPAVFLAITGVLHFVYYAAAKETARAVERELLPWLYVTDAVAAAGAALEAGKAQASAAFQRAQVQASQMASSGAQMANNAQAQAQTRMSQAQNQYAQQQQQQQQQQNAYANYGSQPYHQAGSGQESGYASAPPPPPPSI